MVRPSIEATRAAARGGPRPLPAGFRGPLDEFLTTLRVEAGLARASLAAYRLDLEQFLSWFGQSGGESPEALAGGHIVDFLGLLRDARSAEATVARKLVTIRLFLRFLVREGLLQRDVSASLPSPTLRRLLPHTLSAEEVQSLLEVRSGASWIEQRDRALLELIYATGARVSETMRLTVGDFESRLRVVRLHGKGDKMRLVPVGLRAREALERWLEDGRAQLLATLPGRRPSQIFLSRSGRPMDRVAAWRRVKAAALAAGLAVMPSPHGLRHSFATHMLEGGADLRSVQEMLGHASVRTTEIYTHLDAEHVRGVHSLYHPRA